MKMEAPQWSVMGTEAIQTSKRLCMEPSQMDILLQNWRARQAGNMLFSSVRKEWPFNQIDSKCANIKSSADDHFFKGGYQFLSACARIATSVQLKITWC